MIERLILTSNAKISTTRGLCTAGACFQVEQLLRAFTDRPVRCQDSVFHACDEVTQGSVELRGPTGVAMAWL